MTILHVNRQPAKFNAIQWDGSNWDEIQEAVNENLFRLLPVGGSQMLYINEARTNTNFAIVPLSSWIVSFEYWGSETVQFGFNFYVFTDEEFQSQFIVP